MVNINDLIEMQMVKISEVKNSRNLENGVSSVNISHSKIPNA